TPRWAAGTTRPAGRASPERSPARFTVLPRPANPSATRSSKSRSSRLPSLHIGIGSDFRAQELREELMLEGARVRIAAQGESPRIDLVLFYARQHVVSQPEMPDIRAFAEDGEALDHPRGGRPRVDREKERNTLLAAGIGEAAERLIRVE